MGLTTEPTLDIERNENIAVSTEQVEYILGSNWRSQFTPDSYQQLCEQLNTINLHITYNPNELRKGAIHIHLDYLKTLFGQELDFDTMCMIIGVESLKIDKCQNTSPLNITPKITPADAHQHLKEKLNALPTAVETTESNDLILLQIHITNLRKKLGLPPSAELPSFIEMCDTLGVDSIQIDQT